jgi:mannose-6-phosphate isomerase-like protein (cupin superfamily)
MTDFETRAVAETADAVAPDGSDVRILASLRGASMAHFSLAGHATSVAVRHRTVGELWYFVAGAGQMWRSGPDRNEVTSVAAGVSISIPVGTSFQFRATSDEALIAIGVTMPPWPGAGEAEVVTGPWPPTVEPGPI